MGTGEDSILWRNTNGDTELWNSQRLGRLHLGNLGVVNTSWQIAGTGDFTGTGEASILWRNTNGDTELWNPNGSGGFTYQNLGVVNTSWQIVGTGDFSGDGQSGICGAIPMAIRSCGIPTARAASPMKIWASSTRAGLCTKFSLETHASGVSRLRSPAGRRRTL